MVINGKGVANTSYMCSNSQQSSNLAAVCRMFHLERLRPELWWTLCATYCVPRTVQPRAACAGTSLTLDQKRNGFEVKTPHVALDDVERLQ